ncbi:TAXI family TRAP transporter solute-binding subunit [Enterovirga aerilata]|uniref:C4-dicarboxylate ABC transporter substrate-binding protein n=1 Tax=Enterovirga aerilata TaxID=2730920 RepID=A0A849I2P3_9HYPH|nr:TAXI family TRAP transporter solute-binding subunit [Enterovirga sp. DB1703]NNM74076.1 C4-dicarboxylate ABC transporter substrate-binding protein [Enterovirga sp. DB1703]
MNPWSALAIAGAVAVGSFADASPASAQRAQYNRAQEAPVREKLNAWTLGLAAGLLEGAPIRFAVEMARIVDDGENLHVLPIVTRGPAENLEALLYIRGIDAAILNTDSLEQFKPLVPNIQKRITSILNLFPSELHVFVRPEIGSLQDLAGKKVNFNTPGTAAAYSGPIIFDRLGVQIEKTFVPHQAALEQMRRGEMAAVIFITSKPVDAFSRTEWPQGFKFLPVEYDKRFEDYYLPSSLTASDYPRLIGAGTSVRTIAVPTFLAAYNWPRSSPRYQRVARLVDRLFSHIGKLQEPGFHPKWREVSILATVPGLDRFPAAQEWLDRAQGAPRSARGDRAALPDEGEQPGARP